MIIEQARINVQNRYAKIFLSQESNPRVYQNHLMEESLRLYSEKIEKLDECGYKFKFVIDTDKYYKLKKQEGIE